MEINANQVEKLEILEPIAVGDYYVLTNIYFIWFNKFTSTNRKERIKRVTSKVFQAGASV